MWKSKEEVSKRNARGSKRRASEASGITEGRKARDIPRTKGARWRRVPRPDKAYGARNPRRADSARNNEAWAQRARWGGSGAAIPPLRNGRRHRCSGRDDTRRGTALRMTKRCKVPTGCAPLATRGKRNDGTSLGLTRMRGSGQGLAGGVGALGSSTPPSPASLAFNWARSSCFCLRSACSASSLALPSLSLEKSGLE